MLNSTLPAFIWGGLAASTLLIGYVLADRHLSNRVIGLIMGFGAGALIAAIAYELVPESKLTGVDVIIAFGLGALAFFAGDWLIDRQGGADRKDIAGGQEGGSGSAIFIGTLLDGVPESITLGMGLAVGGTISIAFFTAILVSNIPEGVAGTLNMEASGRSYRSILWRWVALIIISAVCAALGFAVIRIFPGVDGHLMQAFAAGAMLMMLADAMMPEAFEHGGNLVGITTVLGFLMAATLSTLE